MIRRSFLKALGSALVGLTLVRTIPGIGGGVPVVPPPISTELRVGDVVTFEGKYAFNPTTRQQTEHLQRFIVSAVTEGDEGESVTLHPHIYGQPDKEWRISL